MQLPEGFEYPFMRVKPFNGLMIDEQIWEADQVYHHSHSRIHNLFLHGYGIIQGFEVTARDPADRAVRVSKGMAVDHHGNLIILPQDISLPIQKDQEGTFYVTAVYQDIDEEERFSQLHGGKSYPTRVRDGVNVYARVMLPPGAYVELARIQVKGKGADVKIVNAGDALRPKDNEIDLRYRVNSDPYAQGMVSVFILSVPGQDAAAMEAVKYWIREIEMSTGLRVKYLGCGETVPEEANLALLTGSDVSGADKDGLKGLLERKGTLFIDGSGEGFMKSAESLADALGDKVVEVKRGHDVLTERHLFSSAPDGGGKAVLKAGKGIIISGSDYATAWQGGGKTALSREIIRGSLELGANVAAYAFKRMNSVE